MKQTTLIIVLLCVLTGLVVLANGVILFVFPDGILFSAIKGLMIVAGVVGILVIAGLIYLWIQAKSQEAAFRVLRADAKKKMFLPKLEWDEEEQGKVELLQKKIELSTLQAQINPHFLYNTLDSIRSQALMEDQKEIAMMTEKLSRFFRYCISNREFLVQVKEELNHIEDYKYIQKFRFGDRFDMEVEVENDTLYDYYIPKLTIQPFIENAIVHGLEKVTRKGLVRLSVFETQSKLVIKVSDNGCGMSEAKLREMNEKLKHIGIQTRGKNGRHNGIAISNINSRIRLTFGEEYGIHYRSIEGIGTDVEVLLPKVNDFDRSKYEHSEVL